MKPPIPDDEAERVATLRRVRVLDTAPEPSFDRVTRLASRFLGMPIALVSLVDRDRQWFKSKVGLDAMQTPREHAFCAHAIYCDELMVVTDAKCDHRFQDNPLVVDTPGIRFYAGVPLRLNNQPLGTLCVIDRRPRDFNAADRETLEDLGAIVENELSLRHYRSTAEQQLELLALAEDIAGVGHWRLNVAENHLFWSRQIYELFGREEGTFTPSVEAVLEAIHAEDRTQFGAFLQQSVGGATSFDGELRISRPNRVQRRVHVRGECRKGDTENSITDVFGTMQDITEREELRARLQQAEKLASIGTLATGVAHEVNNPLSYITTNADHLAEEIDDMSGESPPARLLELRAVVDEIRDGTRRIHRVVKGLKTFSRASSEQSELIELPRVFDIAQRLCMNELRHRAQLEVEIDPTTPMVLGDESQLVQVVVNLLVNAAHAIPDGAEATHRIRIRAGGNDKGQTVFTVEDNGVGMTEQQLVHAFTPFYTTKAPGVGTGLGLAISHGIITSHGGEITVTSELGKGTAVHVVLPGVGTSGREETIISNAPSRSQPKETPLKILIIDDDLLVSRSLRRVLHPHEVLSTPRAEEALKWLREGQEFAVMICDLMMPNMTGAEFATIVAREHPHLHERIVFITGGAFSIGGQVFAHDTDLPLLEKPLNLQQLRTTIRSIGQNSGPDGNAVGRLDPGV